MTAGLGERLRRARQARGYSQQQLAGMAGVSRQALSSVEAGHSDPSLRVALALAGALGMAVEEVFGPPGPPVTVAVRPVAPLGGDGARVTLAPMGDSFIALPLSGDAAARVGFAPAGGVVTIGEAGNAADAGTGARSGGVAEGGAMSGHVVRLTAPPGPTLVVAGCDPALPLLAPALARLDPPVGFTWWACSSAEALRLAAAGLVHVAGAHLRGRSGEYNTGPAREMLRRDGAGRGSSAGGSHDHVVTPGAEVIGFARWREGLVFRPGLAGTVTSLADVAAQGLTLVNREAGSEARRVLDREAAKLGITASALPGYSSRATGHLPVASAVAAGLADVGVASEPAALAYGLGFVPLADERFDLVILAGQQASREVSALRKVLASPWLLAQLAALPGYDAAACGELVAAW